MADGTTIQGELFAGEEEAHFADGGGTGLLTNIFSGIPEGLTSAQRSRVERELRRMACSMVHWFADRAFTCPDSLNGTIETYREFVLRTAHHAVPENAPW